MSDLEKLFEHAPEGATEIVVWEDGELRYANAEKTLAGSIGEWVDRTLDWQTIATRPQPEQTRKTVEDAVADHKGKWPYSAGCIFMAFRGDYGDYFAHGSNYEYRKGHYLVCTREQFEACVAAKGEPKWTHEINGLLCKVLNDKADCLGKIVVELKDSGYATPRASTVKPIKSAITEAEIKKLREYLQWTAKKGTGYVSDLIEEFINEHDITD